MNPGVLEGKAVPASYKTPVVLHIYIIKFGKSFGILVFVVLVDVADK